jgi:hypothetical protein
LTTAGQYDFRRVWTVLDARDAFARAYGSAVGLSDLSDYEFASLHPSVHFHSPVPAQRRRGPRALGVVHTEEVTAPFRADLSTAFYGEAQQNLRARTCSGPAAAAAISASRSPAEPAAESASAAARQRSDRTVRSPARPAWSLVHPLQPLGQLGVEVGRATEAAAGQERGFQYAGGQVCSMFGEGLAEPLAREPQRYGRRRF